MTKRISRRDLLKTSGVLGAALLANGFLGFGQEGSAGSTCKIGEDRLKTFSNKVRSGGVPPDGIPPIDEPKYVSAEEASGAMGSNLSDESVVFGVDYGDTTKAYPQFILVWHEIVNEEIDGQKASISYCPLTGSAIGYRGAIGENLTTFGTSGKLLNSNLVMYDRKSGTKSYWPQILGRSVQGPNFGDRLDFFPVIWTTWGRWKAKHPETKVLTTDTNYIRAYGSDPYGSYQKSNTYYQQGSPMFGVMAKSDRLQPKKVVVGIKVKDCSLAVPKDEFRSTGLVNTELGGEPIVIVYEESLDTVRAFSRKVEGKTREFSLNKTEFVSRPDGTAWSIEGGKIEGPIDENRLKPVSFFDVMWFAWYSFYPETEVLEV